MPTGYTARIAEDDFNTFVWRCARGMGALIMMRDEPMDKPVPDRFEPSDHHPKALTEARDHLTVLCSMSMDSAEQAYTEWWDDEVRAYEERVDENIRLVLKYDRMIEKVTAWKPPTADHGNFKAFMLDQLCDSKRFDCHEPTKPVREMPGVWLQTRVRQAKKDIAYHEKHGHEEQERTEERNAWIAALRESVTPPWNKKENSK